MSIDPKAEAPVLRVAVATIDATALAAALRERSRAFASLQLERGRSALPAGFFADALDDIERRIALSAERSAPLEELPRRFGRVRALSPLLLRGYNYLFKRNREAAVEQTQALISLLEILRFVCELLEEPHGR